MEIWKEVIGYEKYFLVSNLGDIYSKRSGKKLKQHTNHNGYKVFATKIGGRLGENFCFRIHRLVAMAFIDNPENKGIVNHIDGDKSNNRVENLEWVTACENAQHALEIGLVKRGARPNLRKIKNSEAVVSLYNTGSYSMHQLGELFGVSHNTIGRLVNGYASDKN